MKAATRQREAERNAQGVESPIPFIDAALAIGDVGVAQDLVHRIAERDVLARDLPVSHDIEGIATGPRTVLLVLVFLGAPFETRGEERGGVRGDLAAEQIERERVPEVQIPLYGGQIDDAVLSNVVRVLQLVVDHDLSRSIDDAPYAGLSD